MEKVVTIEVIDTTAPTLAPIPNTTILWPPNHALIPVEIKGLKYTKKNSDYFRGLHMARKQVSTVTTVMSQYLTQKQLIIRRGIVILCCVENGQFHMEIHWQSI